MTGPLPAAQSEVEQRALAGQLCVSCYVQLDPPRVMPAQCWRCYQRDQPHACTTCGGRFATADELARHRRNCG